MANRDAPLGGRLVGHLYGSPHTAKTREYVILATDASPAYVGDAIVQLEGLAPNEIGIQLPIGTTSPLFTAGKPINGFILAFKADPNNLSINYRPGLALRTAIVCDDPYALFELQMTGISDGTEVGMNIDLLYGAGSPISGCSGTMLDRSVMGSATHQMRIMGIVQRADNTIGEFCKFICMINEHIYKQAAGV